MLLFTLSLVISDHHSYSKARLVLSYVDLRWSANHDALAIRMRSWFSVTPLRIQGRRDNFEMCQILRHCIEALNINDSSIGLMYL